MYSLVILAALTVATANGGLIGAPLAAPIATSIVGARTISLAGPTIAAPIGLTSPLIGASPLIGKSLIAAPALAAPGLVSPWGGLGLGAPLLGRSILAAPAVSTLAYGPALSAGPVLKAW